MDEIPTTLSRVSGVPSYAGTLIRVWRQRAKLTQEGLAQALEVTFSTVSRWENGHVVPSRLAWTGLLRLADDLGVPLEIEEPTSATAEPRSGAPSAGIGHASSPVSRR